MVDAADTLSDKGGRGDNNNDDNYGGKGSNMDNVIGATAVLYISKEEDGGSLIVLAPEGRTTIGLMMKRTWWWMLTLRRMWCRIWPTLCLTRVEEEATTTTAIMGAGEAVWMMLLAWQLYCMFLMKRMGGV